MSFEVNFMERSIRYTCAKKKHPVLKEDCKKCEMYTPCAKDGKWCFVGALVAEHESTVSRSAIGENFVCAVAPVLRDQSTVTIHLDSKNSVDILKEDIAVQIKKALYSSLNGCFDWRGSSR